MSDPKPPPWPGRVLRSGVTGLDVKAVQLRLDVLGYPVQADGQYSTVTESTVKLFQTRHGLRADGWVGQITWAELFGADSILPWPTLQASVLQIGVIAWMRNEILTKKVRETRRNWSPRISEYFQLVGLPSDGSYSWCLAMIYAGYAEAAKALKTQNPCTRTAKCMELWRRSPPRCRVLAAAALDDPRLIRPGVIFVIDHGNDQGHCGVVDSYSEGQIKTMEGNTNDKGSREGTVAAVRTRSLSAEGLLGFIDYAVH